MTMNDSLSRADSAWSGWPLDREVVLTRVIDAPRSLVFAAWMDAEHIGEWFGPDGMTIETKEANLTAGGTWRFDMVAPDGTRYDSRMMFLRVEAPALIEVDYGRDQDADPDKFRMLVTFDEQQDGKTVLTLRQMHPSKARRDMVVGFGAVEYGGQTVRKLAEHVEKMRA
jgi:uncharacterized protein YndB with AHSA1/START domain